MHSVLLRLMFAVFAAWLVVVQVCAQQAVTEIADAPAESELVVPPQYMGRTIAQTMHYLGAEWLTRETREREEACSKLIAALELKPGLTVCDLGCGNGYYTVEMAPLVGPRGVVWAVDIQPEMLEMLRERAEKQGISNIQPVLGTVVDPKLPDGTIDLLLLVDVYHEFSNPEEMFREMRESLKPEGRIALVEYREEDPDVPIKPLHKMSQPQVMKEYEANGFKLVGQFDELPWQHVFFFARDDSPLEEVELRLWEKPQKSPSPEGKD